MRFHRRDEARNSRHSHLGLAGAVHKAEALGLSVVYVNPAYTSQTCSVCGAIGKRDKHRFSCSCGNRRHADVNASVNIAGFAEPIGPARAAVNQPVFAHYGLRDVVKSSGL